MFYLPSRSRWLALALAASFIPTFVAAQTPQGVSPGSVSQAVTLANSCPTFSWSNVEGSTGYELALYQVGKLGELTPLLQVKMPKGSSSWTPAMAQCPHSGGAYAWAVRALTPSSAGPWSEALLFETADVPSDDEVRRALDILYRYREKLEHAETSRSANELEAASPEATDALLGLRALSSTTQSTHNLRPRTSMAPNPTSEGRSLTVDSNIELGVASNIFKNGELLLWTDSANNTALGRNAMQSTDGYNNTANGAFALFSNTADFNTASEDRARIERRHLNKLAAKKLRVSSRQYSYQGSK